MSIRKRNEFLDGDESDEELDDGYDSEAVEESKGAISGRVSKRRKLNDASSDEDAVDGDEEPGERLVAGEDEDAGVDAETGFREEDENDPDEDAYALLKTKDSTLKPSAPKHVAAAEKAARKSGVVYISRVPPFMKPQTLKHFLSPHASKGLGRIFLTPEDHVQHTRRVKSGGNKKKSFTDGWVEFVSKREAKIAAETLNGNIIGGKKGNFYHDDLWNMKYLTGFKWSHLTEQIANENAERAARIREEVRRTRVENKAFVEDVEKGKMLVGMERKGKAKLVRDGMEGAGTAVKRHDRGKAFKQKVPEKSRGSDDGAGEQRARVERMSIL